MKLFVRETGSPANPAIIFLHASPLSGSMWLPQLERLTDYHCLVPDLPGHGQSDCVPLNMQALVQQLVKLIRETTPHGKAHVIGLSFGGVVAQALMVGAPEVVDHVILSGTSTRMSKLLVKISELNQPVLRLLRPEQLAALVCLQFGIPTQYRALMAGDFKVYSSSTLSQVMQTYLEIEMPSATRSPTLVAVGQKETVVARRAARILSRSIPGAKGVLIPGCGHVWNLEAPDLFAETVRAWVTDQPLPHRLLPLSEG